MKYQVVRKIETTFRYEPVEWQPGEVVELSEEDAAWFNRDSEGCLIPVVETQSVDAPPQDRMVKRAPRKRNQSGGEAITRDNFKAVKDK